MFQRQEDPFAAIRRAAAQAAEEPEPQRQSRGLKRFALQYLGTAAELPLAAARGALAIPAGLERAAGTLQERLGLPDLLPDVEFTPLEDIIERTEYSQQILQEIFGNDENALLNFTGEMAGAIAVGAPAIKGVRAVVGSTKGLLAKYGPGIFKQVSPEAGRVATALGAGAEGGLFIAGIDPHSSKGEIIFGVAAGTLLGAAAGRLEALTARRAAKTAAIREATGDAAIGAEAAANIEANLRLTANLADDVAATADETVASIRATLSAAGDGGALGVVRGVELPPARLAELQAEFPNFRFEQVVPSTSEELLLGATGGKIGAGTLKPPRQLPLHVRQEVGPLSGSISSADDLKVILEGDAAKIADVFDKPSIGPSAVRAAINRIRELTQRSLKARGAGDEIIVFRGGPIREDVVGVTTERVTARLFAARTGNEGVIRAFRVKTADVLADVGAFSDAFTEAELLVPRSALSPLGDTELPRLVYGLRPGIRLPGGTRKVPGLTDRVLANFRETGFLPYQRVLLDGTQEVEFLGTKGGRTWVKEPGRQRFSVESSRITAGSREVGGQLENPPLLARFREFMNVNQFDDIDEGFDAFVATLDDFDPALKPHLKEYFVARASERVKQLLRPDERGVLETFIAARRRMQEFGFPMALEDVAAAKAISVTRLGGGRVKLTNMVTGETIVRPSAQQALEEISKLEAVVPDLTPKIKGVHADLLRGVAVPAAPFNPAYTLGEDIIDVSLRAAVKQSPEALANVWYKAGRFIKGIEAQAIRTEDKLGIPIWSKAIQPLSLKVTLAMNRGNRVGRIAAKTLRGLSDEEEFLVEGWLRSELKETFETANNMSPALIKRAEQLRMVLIDIFDELSTQSGTKLSPDNFFRNYVPDMLDLAERESRIDLIAALKERGQFVPEDLKFWNELFKSGELAMRKQAPLGIKVQRMIRAGYRKAYAGEEFEQARALFETIDNIYAKRTLADYLTGVAGNWDLHRDFMQRIVREFYADLGVRLPPDKLSNIVDDLVGASYGGLMGARVQLALRNHTQMFNLLAPVLPGGFRRVASAFVKASDPANAAWARRIGAVRDQTPVTLSEALEAGEQLSRKARRALRKVERKSLRLYTHADEHNRAVAAIAMRDVLRQHLPKFTEGGLTHTEFARKTGLSVFDTPVRDTFFKILSGERMVGTIGLTAEERAINYAAREMSNFTNFLYGAQNAPAWIRTIPGKVAGSYSTFPFGYINYLGAITRNGTSGEKIARWAKHGLVNFAIHNAGRNVGINLTRWVAFQSIFWGGGPYVGVVDDIREAWAGPPWKRDEALRSLKRTLPRVLLPAGTFIVHDIPAAITLFGDDRPEAALAAALGFRVEEEEKPRLPRKF